MRVRSLLPFFWTVPLALATACEEVANNNGDAGPNDAGSGCGYYQPVEHVSNTAKAEATLPTDKSEKFLVVAYATSELRTNETTDVTYTKATPGGLIPGGRTFSSKEPLDPELVSYYAKLERRIAAEATLRARSKQGPLTQPVKGGTSVRSYTDPRLGRQSQSAACTAEDPGVCKADKAICVIPEGTTNGTCASSVSLKFALTDPQNPVAVTATVKAVTDGVAIVVDDADTLSDADADALAKRFDEQIAPIDHAIFGEPVQNGRDFDGNGVTTIFVTSKLSGLGDDIVGIFFSDDLRPSGEAAHSNVSDLLYVKPTGPSANLDQLSGTIAHEYQHLINFYAKVVKSRSDREAAWLDEGLGVFAEDITGYGEDAYATHYAYLQDPSNYSLTGNGVLGSGDSIQRRGLASLFVRYLFEQTGGADFGATPAGAGATAIKGIVQGSDIELEAVAKLDARTVHQWIGDFMLALAADGIAEYDCFARYSFATPETVAYTGIRRGVNLRGTFTAGSRTINFQGPVTNTLEAESVPFAWNAGDFRTVDGKGLKISASVPSDGFDGDLERVGLWAIPLVR